MRRHIKYQRVGLHVSAAGGVQNAPENAKNLGAEVFQFFSRSPRGGPAPAISDAQAREFKEKCKQNGFESYIHTPYYINFASKKKSLREAAPRIVREELLRGSLLGVKYVMTHLGSAKEYAGATTERTPNEALNATAEGILHIYAGTAPFSTQLLLEISAGAGSVIGDTFEELAYILKRVGRKDVHICLDTCHMFASGYDLRTGEAIDTTMKEFRTRLGIAQLKLVHINDSKTGLREHKDRHEHIGKGAIGEEGFKALLRHNDFQKVNFVLETKHDTLIHDDLKFLKANRTQQ